MDRDPVSNRAGSITVKLIRISINRRELKGPYARPFLAATSSTPLSLSSLIDSPSLGHIDSKKGRPLLDHMVCMERRIVQRFKECLRRIYHVGHR